MLDCSLHHSNRISINPRIWQTPFSCLCTRARETTLDNPLLSPPLSLAPSLHPARFLSLQTKSAWLSPTLSLPPSITLCLPPSNTLCLPLSISLCLPPSISNSLNHSLSPSISLCLPRSLSISLNLSLPPSIFFCLFFDTNKFNLGDIQEVR